MNQYLSNQKNQFLHSSVGGALPQHLNGQGQLKTNNTLDQYGGRNSALNNINAIVGPSVMGGTGVVGQHHHRNHASNQSANVMVRGMAGVNLINYSIL